MPIIMKKPESVLRISRLPAVLFLFLLLSACGGGDRELSDQQQSQSQSQPQIEQRESDIPYNFRVDMQSLLDHYFELKDAVVDSDLPAAKEAAERLSGFTSDVMESVLQSENRGLWSGISRILRTESDKLIATESDSDLRIYFEHISRSVIRIADSFDPAGGPYYLMECGVAATGENQWLSREEEVRNPYQTSADASCGEIVEQFVN
jgi:hypothetical protein